MRFFLLTLLLSFSALAATSEMSVSVSSDISKAQLVSATNSVMSLAKSLLASATNALAETSFSWDSLASISFDGGSTFIHQGGRDIPAVASSNTGFFFPVGFPVSGNFYCTFSVLAPESSPVFVSVSQPAHTQVWELSFTCASTGAPVDFYLVATITPCVTSTYVKTLSTKTAVFYLRRTF